MTFFINLRELKVLFTIFGLSVTKGLFLNLRYHLASGVHASLAKVH